MQIVKFKTNIRTEKAYQKIAPYLNKVIGSVNWQLDMCSDDKVLTVYNPAIVLEDQIMEVFRQAGFMAVNLEDYYSYIHSLINKKKS